MGTYLDFFAGKSAFQFIQDHGLTPKHVRMILGAAGGPKCLPLFHLDFVIFSIWLRDRTTPLPLVGSSIGAWRFAAASAGNHGEAIYRFYQAYARQAYLLRPSAKEVSRESRRILYQYLTDSAVKQILQHPVFRLNILTVRCKGATGVEMPMAQFMGFAAAILANRVHRSGLGLFFERALFYDSRNPPAYPGNPQDPFITHTVALDPNNLKPALLASGSIPLVMEGIRDIAGAAKGMYRDGGILDYHPARSLLDEWPGVILYPHFMHRIIPGWLDKRIRNRKHSLQALEHLLVVVPSREFIQSLPNGKIPDRTDFYRYSGRDSDRFRAWNVVLDRSRLLADEFYDTVTSGRIRQQIQPLETMGM